MSMKNESVDAFIAQVEQNGCSSPETPRRTWVGLVAISVPRTDDVDRILDRVAYSPRLNTERFQSKVLASGDCWVKLSASYTAHGASAGDIRTRVASVAGVPKGNVVVERIRVELVE